ncbi:uncharacterized protein LOC141682885 [Apium graveolens]|uniref:uncharacterized protein LOC141682885 n=1 Tax=Apium graveolens TaxID=4045 RepID=UPI003D792E9E
MSSKSMILLRSSDNETFQVEKTVAVESLTIKHLLEADSAYRVIDLHNVTGNILAKVIEYCRIHVESPKDDDKLKTFDAEFVKVDQQVLFDLIMAANYLNIKNLLDLTSQTVADMSMRNFNPEEKISMSSEKVCSSQAGNGVDQALSQPKMISNDVTVEPESLKPMSRGNDTDKTANKAPGKEVKTSTKEAKTVTKGRSKSSNNSTTEDSDLEECCLECLGWVLCLPCRVLDTFINLLCLEMICDCFDSDCID